MLSSPVDSIHNLRWQRRQIHRSFWIALCQISNDVEYRNRTNQLALLDERNIPKTSLVHESHCIADGGFLSQGLDCGLHPFGYRRASISIAANHLSQKISFGENAGHPAVVGTDHTAT